MEEKERIELLKWLITRSDSLRSSYSNRAALILSADAIILAIFVFLLEKILSQATGVLGLSVIVLSLLSLACMSVSLVLAITISASIRGSRKATGFRGAARFFLSPPETFEELKDFESFIERFKSMSSDDFIKSGCAELWVDLRLQQLRYNKLKKAIQFILAAFLLLVLALVIALFYMRSPL